MKTRTKIALMAAAIIASTALYGNLRFNRSRYEPQCEQLPGVAIYGKPPQTSEIDAGYAAYHENELHITLRLKYPRGWDTVRTAYDEKEKRVLEIATKGAGYTHPAKAPIQLVVGPLTQPVAKGDWGCYPAYLGLAEIFKVPGLFSVDIASAHMLPLPQKPNKQKPSKTEKDARELYGRLLALSQNVQGYTQWQIWREGRNLEHELRTSSSNLKLETRAARRLIKEIEMRPHPPAIKPFWRGWDIVFGAGIVGMIGLFITSLFKKKNGDYEFIEVKKHVQPIPLKIQETDVEPFIKTPAGGVPLAPQKKGVAGESETERPRQGKGLYSADFYSKLLDHKKVHAIINPIKSNDQIVREARLFASEFAKNELKATYDLFDRLKIDGGSYRINFDLDSDRLDGCFNASEVLSGKKGCCLEHTYLFLSICNKAGLNELETRALGFMINTFSTSRPGWHACGGLLFNGLPSALRYNRFESDPFFRKQVLEIAGVQDKKNLNLLLLDFTNSEFAAQHFHLEPMSNAAMVSAYLNNSANYFHGHDDYEEACSRLEEAVRLGDRLARSNLASLYYENKEFARVLELTEDPKAIVNSAALISRADVLLSKGDSEGAKVAALNAIQMSRPYWGYYTLGDIYEQENDHKTAALAFEKAFELNFDYFDETLSKASLAEKADASTRISAILLRHLANSSIISGDVKKIDSALHTLLLNNQKFNSQGGLKSGWISSILLNKEFKPRDGLKSNLIRVKNLGAIKESVIDSDCAAIPFDAYLKLESIDKAKELFYALDEPDSALQSYMEGSIIAAEKGYKRAKYQLADAVLAKMQTLLLLNQKIFKSPGKMYEFPAASAAAVLNHEWDVDMKRYFSNTQKGNRDLAFSAFGTNFYITPVFSTKNTADFFEEYFSLSLETLFFLANSFDFEREEPYLYVSKNNNYREIGRQFTRSIDAFNRRALGEALESCNAAINLEQSDYELYLHRAAIYDALGDTEMSSLDYAKAAGLEVNLEQIKQETEILKQAFDELFAGLTGASDLENNFRQVLVSKFAQELKRCEVRGERT